MKLSAVLSVSLTVNLGLAAAFIARPSAARTFFHEMFSSGEAPRAERRAAATTTARTPVADASVRNTALGDFNWAKLEATDYTKIMARLTEIGVPRETARAFVAVLMMKDFNQQRRALRPQPNPLEFWRNPVQRTDPAELVVHRELEREHKRLMRDVLGGDFEFDDDDAAQRRRYGNLSDDKIARLKKIFADYRDLEEQLFADGGDRGSADFQARNALLAKEKRADLERLLTPEELLDYDLRNSAASHRLRAKFGAFEPTEAEFRALYPHFKAGEQELRPTFARGGNMAEMRRTRENAERQAEAELRRVLGEARFTQWQEANDHTLHETRTLVASLNLPPHALTEIVAIQKEFQPQIINIERSRDLTPNQRDTQLFALTNEARNRLTRVLGPNGFEAYKRRGGGWLGGPLNRTTPTAPPQ